jgi:amidase
VTDPVNGDDFTGGIFSSSPSAIAGYASVTLPAGYVGPLPVGISFIGARWSEPELIAFAYALEAATHVRVPPSFLPSLSAGSTAAPGTSLQRRDVVRQPSRVRILLASR